MEITVTKIQTPVAVTVLQPHGALDASTYQDLVSKAHDVYEEGARNLIIDLGDTPFMSSSGIVALHTIALLLHGENSLLPESGTQKRIKLVNPPPRVDHLLEMAGFKRFIESFTTMEGAIASLTA